MERTNTITVTVNGKSVECRYGILLSDLLGMEAPCGGHGKCGKCKVVARGALSLPSKSETEHLSKAEIAAGVRLACCTTVLGACEITHDSVNAGVISLTGSSLSAAQIKKALGGYGVALDIGTTTLAARLYSPCGELVAEDGRLNPQTLYGADVISRIERALGGSAAELATLIRKAVDDICRSLCLRAGISTYDITSVVLTGNTVMLHLLTNTDVYPLSRAPFIANRLFGEALNAASLELTSLSPETSIYLPPCISAFVGADTVCAVLSCGLCNKAEPYMLIDAGTNGEMALWDGSSLSVCSTAAGPAFEGVGISCGMRGAAGAIDKVQIVNGRLSAHTVGDTAPVGICGSGIVDALACMLELELVEDSGYLEDGSIALADGVELTQLDVQSVQLAKSAICSGLCVLAKRASKTFGEISGLYVAGGFGRYLNVNSAIRIGLLPSALRGRIEAVGNAALEGAAMLLLDPELRSHAYELAHNAAVADLATDALFSELFTENMFLEGVDLP